MRGAGGQAHVGIDTDYQAGRADPADDRGQVRGGQTPAGPGADQADTGQRRHHPQRYPHVGDQILGLTRFSPVTGSMSDDQPPPISKVPALACLKVNWPPAK